MQRKILSIWDKDEQYSSAMANYLEGIHGFPYEVYLFTKKEAVSDFLHEKGTDILLLGENLELEDGLKKQAKEVFFLTEDINYHTKESVTQEKYIYKFQSMEIVLQTILKKKDRRTLLPMTNRYVDNMSSVKIISVYSPWGGSGKTTFSMLLGQGLSRKEKVLYLNFEVIGSSLKGECYNAGEEDITKKAGGMSDFIYYIKQKKEDLISVIHNIKVSLLGMDCMEPVVHYNDIYALETEDIQFLFQKLREQKEYDVVICDIGYMKDTALHILEMSDRIFMPFIQKMSVVEKEISFRRILKLEAMEHFFDKLTCVTMPCAEQEDIKDFKTMCEGKLGEFIWNLVEEI